MQCFLPVYTNQKTHLVWLKTPYWEWFQDLLAKGIVIGPGKEVQPSVSQSVSQCSLRYTGCVQLAHLPWPLISMSGLLAAHHRGLPSPGCSSWLVWGTASGKSHPLRAASSSCLGNLKSFAECNESLFHLLAVSLHQFRLRMLRENSLQTHLNSTTLFQGANWQLGLGSASKKSKPAWSLCN